MRKYSLADVDYFITNLHTSYINLLKKWKVRVMYMLEFFFTYWEYIVLYILRIHWLQKDNLKKKSSKFRKTN